MAKFPIVIFYGGEIIKSQIGADYTIPSKLLLEGNESTTYEGLKSTICECLGFVESQYSVEIHCRMNIGQGGYFYFNLMPIHNNSSWKVASEMCVSRMGVIELFVKMVPKADTCNLTGSQPRSSSASRLNSSVPNTSDQSRSTGLVDGDNDLDLEDLGLGNDDEDDDEDENYIEERGDSEGSSSEDIDGVWNNDDEDEEIVDVAVRRREHYNPFIGLGEVHPTRSMNDTSSFRPADYSLYEALPCADGQIAEKMSFTSKDHLIFALQKWHIEKNRVFVVVDSSTSKYRLKCKDPDCDWRLYAKAIGTPWAIVKCPNLHTCRAISARIDHPQLTAKLIADIIREDVEKDNAMSIKQVRALIRKIFPGVHPKYNKLWRGKEIAIGYVYGSWSGSYALLPRLLNVIVSSNPGSRARIATDPTIRPGDRLFKRAAWAFASCIQAFAHLRPVISIDASHLRGRYMGRFLVAVGYDAENQLMPLAFGIVEKDDLENWGWFMRWLRFEVIGDMKKICVVSDRHLAIRAVFRSPLYGWNVANGEAVHRYCAQHIAENMLKKCHNVMAASKFKKCCRKNAKWNFDKYLKQVENWDKPSRDFLDTVGRNDESEESTETVTHPETWSLHYDKGDRWGVMTSNGSESLHNVFREARQRPICALVIATYYKLLDWFNTRKVLARNLANRNQMFSNRVSNILEKRAEKAQRLEVVVVDIVAGIYQVIAKGERVTRTGRTDRIYGVTVNQGAPPTCKCRKPQNTRIACSHVLAVCAFRNYEPNEFTNDVYAVASLVATWDGRFEIFGGEEDWPLYEGDRVIPDKKLVKKGRRKTKRFNMTMDILEGRLGASHCETCGTIQHTTAQHPPASQQAGTCQTGASTSRPRGWLQRIRRRT